MVETGKVLLGAVIGGGLLLAWRKIAEGAVLEGLEAVTIFPDPFSLVGGATQQFIAAAVFTDGSQADVTDVAVWKGAAPLINNGNGSFSALTINNTTQALVTAAFGGLVGESSGVVHGTTGL